MEWNRGNRGRTEVEEKCLTRAKVHNMECFFLQNLNSNGKWYFFLPINCWELNLPWWSEVVTTKFLLNPFNTSDNSLLFGSCLFFLTMLLLVVTRSTTNKIAVNGFITSTTTKLITTTPLHWIAHANFCCTRVAGALTEFSNGRTDGWTLFPVERRPGFAMYKKII